MSRERVVNTYCKAGTTYDAAFAACHFERLARRVRRPARRDANRERSRRAFRRRLLRPIGHRGEVSPTATTRPSALTKAPTREITKRPRCRAGTDSFCVYQWVSPSGAPPPSPDEVGLGAADLEPLSFSLQVQADVDRLETDASNDLAGWYRETFLAEVGSWTEGMPVQNTPVTVVLLDDGQSPGHGGDWVRAAASRWPPPDRMGAHMLGVARTIEELACPNAGRGSGLTCMVSVESELAFLDQPELPYGRGDAASLVAALHRALDRFGPLPGYLVINISLGIDQSFVPPGSAAERILHHALGRARCEGAVVVAALGNSHGEISSGAHGRATIPAAGGPVGACNAYISEDFEGATLTASDGRVIRAAGAKASGLPLAISRADLPQRTYLATMAEHATPDFAALGAPPEYFVSLTGTSVSSAALSATIAALLSTDTLRGELVSAARLAQLEASMRGSSASPTTLFSVEKVRVHAALARELDRRGLPHGVALAVPSVGPVETPESVVRRIPNRHRMEAAPMTFCGTFHHVSSWTQDLGPGQESCDPGVPIDLSLSLVPQPTGNTCASCGGTKVSQELFLFESTTSTQTERFVEIGDGTVYVRSELTHTPSLSGVVVDASTLFSAADTAGVSTVTHGRVIYRDSETGSTTTSELLIR